MTIDLAARISRLKRDFYVSFADSAKDFEDVHRLRYDVFCAQRGILAGQEGVEADPYDPASRHVALRRVTGELVGTVRLVLGVGADQQHKFPMQRVCGPAVLAQIPLETTGEISRFCLSRDRRDVGEHADTVLRLGLMKGILRASEDARLTHWCAAMEKGLLRLLQLAAIWFEPVGPSIEYFGTRQPAVANIAEVLERGERERRTIWEYVTDGDFGYRSSVIRPHVPEAWWGTDTAFGADPSVLCQQTAIKDFAELALRSDSLSETLAGACRFVAEALGADRARVVDLQKEGQPLLVHANLGWNDDVGDQTTIEASERTAEALALKTAQPVISPDIDLETRCRYPKHLRDSGVRAVANVAIVDHSSRSPFGVLQVGSLIPGQFNDKDGLFLCCYADLVAAAVDRLLGIETGRHGEERLRRALEANEPGSRDAGATRDASAATPADTPGAGQVGSSVALALDLLPTAARSGPLRVLVVDDTIINRDITGAFLRAAGHEVTLASGGAEAVRLAAAAIFDVVLMDVRMPEIDGLEATRRIRSGEGAQQRMPILAVTAQTFADQLEECRQAGMDGHIGKPFTQEMLLKAVSEAAECTDRPERMHGQRVEEEFKLATALALSNSANEVLVDTDGLIFNYATFARIAAFLAPHILVSHLNTLVERSENLLYGLSMIEARSNGSGSLGVASHTLAGSAGMFGFERLATQAGRFEHASKFNTPSRLPFIRSLTTTLQISLQEMRSRAPNRAMGVLTPGTDIYRSQANRVVVQASLPQFKHFASSSVIAPCPPEIEGS